MEQQQRQKHGEQHKHCVFSRNDSTPVSSQRSLWDDVTDDVTTLSESFRLHMTFSSLVFLQKYFLVCSKMTLKELQIKVKILLCCLKMHLYGLRGIYLVFLFNDHNWTSCALCWTVCGSTLNCCSFALQPLCVALVLFKVSHEEKCNAGSTELLA